MINCCVRLENTPEITYKFTEDITKLLPETEMFVRIQSQQILSYIKRNRDLNEITLKYYINEKFYEETFYDKRIIKKIDKREMEKKIKKVLQKSLLYNLLLAIEDNE